MSTESFEYAIEQLREFRWQHATNDEDAIPYINAVKEMHDREIRDTAQREYHRGFEDGQHSMDAEHRAVAMRLRALPMNRVEYDSNLYDIIEAVCGTNKAGDVDLRDELVRLMGGVSDDGCAGCGCAAADCDGDCGLQREEVSDERVADDCGADTGCGGCGCDLHLAGVSIITDELRELPPVGRVTCNGMELDTPEEYIVTTRRQINDIADRIDAQFDRICTQQEAVLQSTIERMADENLTAKDECDHWKREASELRAKLDAITEAVERIKSLGQE